MTKRIPAWLISIMGALFVLIAIVINTTFSPSLNNKIQEKEKEREKLSKEITSLWESHMLADSRDKNADIFLGLLFIANNQDKEDKAALDFLLNKIGYNLKGAILAMRAATGDTSIEDDLPPQEIQQLLYEIKKERDLKAYVSLKKLVDKLRLASGNTINDVNKQREELDEELRELKNQEEVLRMLHITLNILGLSLLLLKDLPIWKH